jgi:glycine C-acetyltransferase/8-amino-7-oxononanoate synthase
MARPPALGLLAQRLEDKRRQGLGRRLLALTHLGGPRARLEGREVLVMASNDYLGLAHHPRLAEAAREAAMSGTGAGASRLVSGNLTMHAELERDIAAFKHTEAAVFFATGYMANLGAVSGLAGPGDLIVSDALNHASLIDACRLSRAEVRVYPHDDWAAAERLLAQAAPGGLRLLVTDGVFSMDGDLAPLPEVLAVARRQGALLVVDDAHATGVWGTSGRGSLEHFGIAPTPELVMVGTFSKALGGLGGFVAGAAEVAASLVQGARSFLYTTAPPPAQVAAAAEALRLVDDEPWRREKLHRLSAQFRGELTGLGFRLLSETGPIVPLLVGDSHQALALGQALLKLGVLAPAMRPPTVPSGTSRIRFTVTAAHEPRDLEQALTAIKRAAKEVGLDQP